MVFSDSASAPMLLYSGLLDPDIGYPSGKGSEGGDHGRVILARNDGAPPSHSHHIASSLHQKDVAPPTGQAPQPLADADYAEAMLLVQLEAGDVFGEDPRLQRPDAVAF